VAPIRSGNLIEEGPLPCAVWIHDKRHVLLRLARSRIPKDHPLRPIREMIDDALKELSADFDVLYSHTGRPSIAPEKLIRALLLQPARR
jgi:transposase